MRKMTCSGWAIWTVVDRQVLGLTSAPLPAVYSRHCPAGLVMLDVQNVDIGARALERPRFEKAMS